MIHNILTQSKVQWLTAFQTESASVYSQQATENTYSGQPQCFFCSFFTAVISTSILSHTIRFHLFISTYVVKLVAGTIL